MRKKETKCDIINYMIWLEFIIDHSDAIFGILFALVFLIGFVIVIKRMISVLMNRDKKYEIESDKRKLSKSYRRWLKYLVVTFILRIVVIVLNYTIQVDYSLYGVTPSSRYATFEKIFSAIISPLLLMVLAFVIGLFVLIISRKKK